MGLLRHRMRLVILLDKAQNINQQLRARLPTICGVDTRTTGRGNSSDVPSHRGGSTSLPRGRVYHRAHQSMDEAEEETRSQTGLQAQSVTRSSWLTVSD